MVNVTKNKGQNKRKYKKWRKNRRTQCVLNRKCEMRDLQQQQQTTEWLLGI